MKCNYVKDHLVLTKTINAETKEQFIEQFKELLIESKPYTGLVYVCNTQRPIPRSKRHEYRRLHRKSRRIDVHKV